MEALIFYSLIQQKYINSKQKKLNCIHCVQETFQIISQLITWKTRLNRNVYDFSIDYNIIDASNIINTHKYLIKKHNIK